MNSLNNNTLGMGYGCFWGDHHTPETDPVRRGWKAATTGPEGKVVIVGQKGVVGCATVMWLPNNRLSILYYMEEPETIANAIKAGETTGQFDPDSEEMEDMRAVGMWLIEKIARYQQTWACEEQDERDEVNALLDRMLDD